MIPYISKKVNTTFLTAFCSKKSQGESDEPKGPKVKTDVPGPQSKELLKKLKVHQNVRNAELFGNYEKSAGNYLVDADGNIFLDLSMQGSKVPLGYNFKELAKIFTDPKSLHSIIDAISINVFPGTCCPSRIHHIVDKVSPNLPNLCMCPCDSLAVEEGLKSIITAFQKYQMDEDTSEQNDCTSLNNFLGFSRVSILSFKNSQHGPLNIYQADPRRKLDVSPLDWPVACYPEYKYPLDTHKRYNQLQDNKSLAMVENFIRQWKDKNLPVAGIIIEPLQIATNHVASHDFLRGLEELTIKNGIYLMFDEIQTCCGVTGNFWAHEHYNLKCPPDILTFGGKTQISGFLHKKNLSPHEEVSVISTNGSVNLSKILIFETIIDFIEKHNLMKTVQLTGDIMKAKLLNLEQIYCDLINSTRGLGTVLAFDVKNRVLRDNFLKRLRKKGIICGKCSNQGIAIRPSLTFNEGHVDIFIKKLEEVLQETSFAKTNLKYCAPNHIFEYEKMPKTELETKTVNSSFPNECKETPRSVEMPKETDEKKIQKQNPRIEHVTPWAPIKDKYKEIVTQQSTSKGLETMFTKETNGVVQKPNKPKRTNAKNKKLKKPILLCIITLPRLLKSKSDKTNCTPCQSKKPKSAMKKNKIFEEPVCRLDPSYLKPWPLPKAKSHKTTPSPYLVCPNVNPQKAKIFKPKPNKSNIAWPKEPKVRLTESKPWPMKGCDQTNWKPTKIADSICSKCLKPHTKKPPKVSHDCQGNSNEVTVTTKSPHSVCSDVRPTPIPKRSRHWKKLKQIWNDFILRQPKSNKLEVLYTKKPFQSSPCPNCLKIKPRKKAASTCAQPKLFYQGPWLRFKFKYKNRRFRRPRLPNLRNFATRVLSYIIIPKCSKKSSDAICQKCLRPTLKGIKSKVNKICPKKSKK